MPTPRSLEGDAVHGCESARARRHHLILDLQDPDRQRKAMRWLDGHDAIRVLNVAGPRESEAPGIYEEAKIFLKQILLRAQ